MSLLLLVVLVAATTAEEQVATVKAITAKDSYLEAFQQVHGLSKTPRITDREYATSSQGFAGYPFAPSQPDGEYGPPGFSAGQIKPQYGPPNPQNSYGPPAPLPPIPQQIYGPTVFYGAPHSMLSIWDKLKFKLDLFTIGKIILKIFLFKKLVSFIAILCLLLFIPWLKHKEESTDDDLRSIKPTYMTADDVLNNLSQYVHGALENYSESLRRGRSSQENFYSKTENILKRINKKMSYKKLAKLYMKDV